MALPTTSIGSLNDLLAIKDQLTSGRVTDDVKQLLLKKKPLPSTFFSDIASHGSFLEDTAAVLLLSEGHIMVRFFCVLVVEVCVCPGHGENDVLRGWIISLLCLNFHKGKRNETQEPTAACRGRTENGWRLQRGRDKRYTLQETSMSCKAPKLRNGECEISAT